MTFYSSSPSARLRVNRVEKPSLQLIQQVCYKIAMRNWKDVKKELLKDPAVKKEYDRLVPRYAVISQLIEARIKNKMTQADIAKKMGTKQSAIARLESGNLNPSLDFLQKVAQTMGLSVRLSRTT